MTALRLTKSSFALVLLFFMTIAYADNIDIDTNADGVALQGHDPVAYFTDAKPTAGTADFSAEHNGATYYFSNAENRDMFTANPDKYAPQYGGFCAFGTTFSKKVPGDPQAWEIVDGKLYINSSPDIKKRWSEDISGNVDKANGIWPNLLGKDPKDL